MPALAESRNRVLRVLLDENMRDEELVTAIESDVALVVAVMRIANADKRRRGRVGSVPDAVRVLAPEGVETLARRIGVYGFFERIPGLYAAGEVAGMAGGHINGKAGLEGTMLGPAIFSGRVAGGWAAHEAGYGPGFTGRANRPAGC